MKKHLTFSLLIILTVSAFTIKAVAADRWETLRAINWVENPTNQTKVGRFGELGPYQFRPTTWRMHTNKPFRLAIQRQEADEVAVLHYEYIKRSFENAGIEVNPFNIALAWNSGVDAVLSGRAPASSYHYAERVTNLVETFQEGRRNLEEQRTISLDTANTVKTAEPQPVVPDEWQVRFRVLQDPPHFVIAAG